jgi:disulfide bond formation protein DsbB
MLTLMGLMGIAALVLSFALPVGRAGLREVVAVHPRAPLALSWLVVLIASLGSLYLSEVRQLEPCMLCWYQRIAMYPLVIVLGVALLRRDVDVWMTALPLALIGGVTSIYHVLVQWMPSIEVTQCSTSAPCSLRYFVLYGFVTIPAMAGTAFLLTSALLVTHGWLGPTGNDLGKGSTHASPPSHEAPPADAVSPPEAPPSDPA